MAGNVRIEIHKSMMLEEWANTYLVEAANFDEAQTYGDLLVTFERNMHKNLVHFDYYRISSRLAGDRAFRHVAINQLGLLNPGSSEWLPLFNTLRIDFSTLDSDPCRKYFRQPLVEQDVANGEVTAAALAVYEGLLNTYFMTTILPDNVFSPAGNVVVGASVHPQIQMRQLHRHKRKKVVA